MKARSAQLDALEASIPRPDGNYTRLPGGTHRYVAKLVDELDTSGAENLPPFTSQEDLSIAMSDPRYKRSPEYRRYINSRLSKSKF